MLSFNDYHGHLEPPSGRDATVSNDPGVTPVGGAEYLSAHLERLRSGHRGQTLTVAAGDLIGGSPFLSGLFKDEPSVETLDVMGLDVSSVGNHELDEGVDELLRMQYGGCHRDGCFDGDGYAGADFRWLAANVRYRPGTPEAGRPILPPVWVKRVKGVKVGFIGMTLEGTPQIVAQAGIRNVEFLDEVKAGNAAARALLRRGVRAIVVLLHEGGLPTGAYSECGPGSVGGAGISGPITEIATNLHSAIDLVVTGHTHQAYLCNIPDRDGRARWVTSASSYGRIITETTLPLDRRTGDVVREAVRVQNHLVTRDTADVRITAIIDRWKALSRPIANRVVGSITRDIVRGATRQQEGSLVNLVADAQLAAARAPENGGATVAFMNPGGVRADLDFEAISGGERPGEVTYGEAFTVQPFGNLLVTQTMTGAAIEQALEQQFTAAAPGGPAPNTVRLLLGVSGGFAYAYDLRRPTGDVVDPATVRINGAPLDPAATYRVTVNSFLADGGDEFAAFTSGTGRVGAGVDLDAFTAYLAANSPVAPAPTDRVTELP